MSAMPTTSRLYIATTVYVSGEYSNVVVTVGGVSKFSETSKNIGRYHQFLARRQFRANHAPDSGATAEGQRSR